MKLKVNQFDDVKFNQPNRNKRKFSQMIRNALQDNTSIIKTKSDHDAVPKPTIAQAWTINFRRN